jgi:hypothetical protein
VSSLGGQVRSNLVPVTRVARAIACHVIMVRDVAVVHPSARQGDRRHVRWFVAVEMRHTNNVSMVGLKCTLTLPRKVSHLQIHCHRWRNVRFLCRCNIFECIVADGSLRCRDRGGTVRWAQHERTHLVARYGIAHLGSLQQQHPSNMLDRSFSRHFLRRKRCSTTRPATELGERDDQMERALLSSTCPVDQTHRDTDRRLTKETVDPSPTVAAAAAPARRMDCAHSPHLHQGAYHSSPLPLQVPRCSMDGLACMQKIGDRDLTSSFKLVRLSVICRSDDFVSGKDGIRTVEPEILRTSSRRLKGYVLDCKLQPYQRSHRAPL